VQSSGVAISTSTPLLSRTDPTKWSASTRPGHLYTATVRTFFVHAYLTPID
jgi:hypothetical protein